MFFSQTLSVSCVSSSRFYIHLSNTLLHIRNISISPRSARVSLDTNAKYYCNIVFILVVPRSTAYLTRVGHGSGPSTGRVGLVWVGSGWVGSQDFPSLVGLVGSGPLSKSLINMHQELVLDEHIYTSFDH